MNKYQPGYLMEQNYYAICERCGGKNCKCAEDSRRTDYHLALRDTLQIVIDAAGYAACTFQDWNGEWQHYVDHKRFISALRDELEKL